MKKQNDQEKGINKVMESFTKELGRGSSSGKAVIKGQKNSPKEDIRVGRLYDFAERHLLQRLSEEDTTRKVYRQLALDIPGAKEEVTYSSREYCFVYRKGSLTFAELLQSRDRSLLLCLADYLELDLISSDEKQLAQAVADRLCDHPDYPLFMNSSDSLDYLKRLSDFQEEERIPDEAVLLPSLDRLISAGMADFQVESTGNGTEYGIISLPSDLTELLLPDYSKQKQKMKAYRELEDAIEAILLVYGYAELEQVYSQCRNDKICDMDYETFTSFILFRCRLFGKLMSAKKEEGGGRVIWHAGCDAKKVQERRKRWDSLSYYNVTKEDIRLITESFGDRYPEWNKLRNYINDNWYMEDYELSGLMEKLVNRTASGASVAELCSDLYRGIGNVTLEEKINLWSGIFISWQESPVYELKGNTRLQACRLLEAGEAQFLQAQLEAARKAENRGEALSLWELPISVQNQIYLILGGFQKKEYSAQAGPCEQLMKTYPGQSELEFLLTRIYLEQKAFGKAEPPIESLLKKMPHDMSVLHYAIGAYLRRDGKKLLGLKEDLYNSRLDTGLLFRYAASLVETDKTAEAIKVYLKLVEEFIPEQEYTVDSQDVVLVNAAYVYLFGTDTKDRERYIDRVTASYISFISVLKEMEETLPEEWVNMIGNAVIEVSKQQSEEYMRKPFLSLLDYLSANHILDLKGFQRIVTSGYESYESYYMAQDKRISENLYRLLMQYGEFKNSLPKAGSGEKQLIRDSITFYQNEVLKEHPGCLAGFVAVEKDYPHQYEALSFFVETVRNSGSIRALQTEYQKKADATGIFIDYGEEDYFTDSFSVPQPVVRNGRKVGRNDPCPCGSGKKYKYCCGKS